MKAAVALLLLGLFSWVEIGFAQWPLSPTPNVPRLSNGKPDLSAPVPRNPDGKPDLSGIWVTECGLYDGGGCFTQSLFFDLTRDLRPEEVQMTPWAAAIQTKRESRNHVDDPYGYCMPPGVPRIDYSGGPFKIIQTPTVTALLYETLVGMMFRQVFTDGRSLPVDPESNWLGYSIGRWDGDTFAVETVGLKDGGWLDTRKGHPHSDALHLTERFRRTDFGHMQLTLNIDDPKAYVKPWSVRANLNLLPDTELLEAFCDSHEKTVAHRQVEPAPPDPPSPRAR